MRRRLAWSTLAAVAVAVLLLGAPLAVAVQVLSERRALEAQQREAEQAQAVLDRQARTVGEAGAFLALIAAQVGARLTLLDAVGRIVVDTGDAPAGAVAIADDVERALDGEVGQVIDGGAIAVSVPVRIRGSDYILRVERSADGLRAEVRTAWLAISVLALAALGGAVLVAGWQGRRFAGPLEDLARSAARLGEGDFSVRAPRSGLPEPDEVGAALDTTAERLGTMLERSRSFSADASHQLRTPLTALRLDLEALQASVKEPVSAELLEAAVAEADRLEATIDELLALARPPEGAESLDVAELAAARLDAWESLARSQGRRVVLRRQPTPPVRARAAAVGQALQVLLDNAMRHGAGTITVAVQPVGGDADGDAVPSRGAPHGVRLCVADEGPGLAPDAEETLFSATGRGLPLARSLIEAEGGRLRLEPARRGAMFCLLLPADRPLGPSPDDE